MLSDFTNKDWHAYQYHLRLQKGDKVIIRTSIRPDRIVQIADDVPAKIPYCTPNDLQRLVMKDNGFLSKEYTCLMLYCDSIQSLPLGYISELPPDFNPLKF